MKVKDIKIRNDGNAVKMQLADNSQTAEFTLRAGQIEELIQGLIKIHASLKANTALSGKTGDSSFEFSPAPPVFLVKELGVVIHPESGALDLKVFSADLSPVLICIQPEHVRQLAQVIGQSKSQSKPPKRAH